MNSCMNIIGCLVTKKRKCFHTKMRNSWACRYQRGILLCNTRELFYTWVHRLSALQMPAWAVARGSNYFCAGDQVVAGGFNFSFPLKFLLACVYIHAPTQTHAFWRTFTPPPSWCGKYTLLCHCTISCHVPFFQCEIANNVHLVNLNFSIITSLLS